MEKTKLYRQGDILLKRVNKIKGKQVAEDKKTLALGEMTGHSHVLKGKGTKFYQEQEQVFIDVPQEAELVHQEHGNFVITKGKYVLIQQREFDLVEGTRQVMD